MVTKISKLQTWEYKKKWMNEWRKVNILCVTLKSLGIRTEISLKVKKEWEGKQMVILMTEKIGFGFLNQDILQYNDEQTLGKYLRIPLENWKYIFDMYL